jgi:hypothetical protein
LSIKEASCKARKEFFRKLEKTNAIANCSFKSTALKDFVV